MSGALLARDAAIPGGSTASIRKPCPEIMVSPDTSFGQSGRPRLMIDVR